MRASSFLGLLLYAASATALFERTYHSSPLEIQPLTILSRSSSYDPTNTTLFLTCPVGKAVAHGSPVIYDSHGELVWASPELGDCANFNVQTYNGKRALTLWTGEGEAGVGVQVGKGTAMILDEHYEVVATVGKNALDLHEFNLPAGGKTALVTQYEPTPANLSEIGGPVHGWYYNSVVSEVDIDSGDVLFSWKSLDHIPLSASYNNLTAPTGYSASQAFDGAHVNSIQKDSKGNYLISARHTKTVYYLSGTDGHIIWQLGGKNSSFTPIGDAADSDALLFNWQHHARFRGDDVISLFDNGAAILNGVDVTVDEPTASAMYLKIDVEKWTVEVVERFLPSPFSGPSVAEGSNELYDTHVVVGYGFNPWVTVYDFSSGDLLLSAIIGPNNSSVWKGGITNYRVFTLTLGEGEFLGQPKTKPSAAVSGGRVYVSWNGAMAVKAWELRSGPAGAEEKELVAVRKVAKSGFETEMSAAGLGEVFRVAALDGNGEVLGLSRTSNGEEVV